MYRSELISVRLSCHLIFQTFDAAFLDVKVLFQLSSVLLLTSDIREVRSRVVFISNGDVCSPRIIGVTGRRRPLDRPVTVVGC